MFSTYYPTKNIARYNMPKSINWQAYMFRYIFYDWSISEKRSIDKWLWFFTIFTTPNITIGAVEYILLLYSRSYPYQLLETSHTSILMQVVNLNAKLLESTTSSIIAYYIFFQSNWSYYPPAAHYMYTNIMGIRYSYLHAHNNII